MRRTILPRIQQTVPKPLHIQLTGSRLCQHQLAVQQPVETPAGGHIELQLAFTFSDGVQLTEGAPSEWQILVDDGVYISVV